MSIKAGELQIAADDRDHAASDREQARADLRRAQLDELTGAFGRELGMVEIEREINRARHGNGRLVLAYVDVDGLKQVNDRLMTRSSEWGVTSSSARWETAGPTRLTADSRTYYGERQI